MEITHYLSILRRYVIYILSAMLLAGTITAWISFNYFPPMYEASVKLLINSTNEADTVDVGTIRSNVKLINTYKEIVKTSDFMSKVVTKHPEINLPADSLSGMLTVKHSLETQVMTLTIRDYSQERAAQIVNFVAETFQTEIGTYLRVNNITLLGTAKEDQNRAPVSPNHGLNILVSAAVACLLTIGLSLLHAGFDDSMYGVKDVEDSIGLPVIAVVPHTVKKDFKSMNANHNDRKVGDMPYATAEQKV